jgi:hypothetical protein
LPKEIVGQNLGILRQTVAKIYVELILVNLGRDFSEKNRQKISPKWPYFSPNLVKLS